MNISEAGKTFIKNREGCRLQPYADLVGVYTVGYGHALTEDDRPWRTLSQRECDDLFDRDIARYAEAVADALSVEVSAWAFDAVCSWTFNVGIGAMRASTLMKHVNAGMEADAIIELLTWNKGGGKRIDGLLLRRARESLIWARGEYD